MYFSDKSFKLDNHGFAQALQFEYSFTYYCNSVISFVVKNKFSTKQLHSYSRTDRMELIYWWAFTLDNYIIAAAQIIYMIVGIQIANLLTK